MPSRSTSAAREPTLSTSRRSSATARSARASTASYLWFRPARMSSRANLSLSGSRAAPSVAFMGEPGLLARPTRRTVLFPEAFVAPVTSVRRPLIVQCTGAVPRGPRSQSLTLLSGMTVASTMRGSGCVAGAMSTNCTCIQPARSRRG